MVKCDKGVVEIDGKAGEVLCEICILIMNYKNQVLKDAQKKGISDMAEEHVNKELQKCIDAHSMEEYMLKEVFETSKGKFTPELADVIKSIFVDEKIDEDDEGEDNEDEDDDWDWDDDEDEEDEEDED